MSKVLLLIKGIKLNQRNDMLKVLAILFIIVSVTTLVLFDSYSNTVNKGLADNLIRLHVIANSDSPEDQALKLKVRDGILEYMKNSLKESRDIEETKYIINTNLNKIEELARAEILKNNRDYSVKAVLGTYAFPTKLYGDITLPAGNYQALRIEIGKAEGANWWCVLFPPLCFVDATHGTIPDSVKQDLKNALTEEEYRIIASASDEDDIPVKVKFRVVEFFQDSKIKFSGMISKLFK